MHASELEAVGLDLGSTLIKTALLDRRGVLRDRRAIPAPPLAGDAGIREGDATAYVGVATELLREVARDLPPRTPLGISSQRSTFVLWDPVTSRPLMPMVSWQDSRASGWCRRHASLEPEVVSRTGLVLSGHYAGPKMASIQAAAEPIRQALHDGAALFGTLETYLIWLWSDGQAHETDPTMAARTSMMDLGDRRWSPDLLRQFDVPLAALPRIRPTSTHPGGQAAGHHGLALGASVADQAAGALAVLPDDEDAVLVNIGTGAFVLRPIADAAERRPGYLTAPIYDPPQGPTRWALEGTVNGAATTIDPLGPSPTPLPARDPSPEAFCLPDGSGLGAPHWRADIGLRFSRAARGLELPDRRRVALEGLLFRIAEILDDLVGPQPPRILLAGGLSREPFVAPGLAALLQRPVETVEIAEGSLLGAARLAAGRPAWARPATTPVTPGGDGAYLPQKFARWRTWLGSLLGQT